MAAADEIKNIFPSMTERFLPEKADGISATILFDLSGDNGGLFWLKISNGSIEHGEGDIGKLALTTGTRSPRAK